MGKVIDLKNRRVNVFSDGGSGSKFDFGSVGSLSGYITDNIANTQKQASIDNVRFDAFKSDADTLSKTQFAVGDNDVLMNQAGMLRTIDPLTKKDLRGNSIGKDILDSQIQGVKGFISGTSATGNPIVGAAMAAASMIASGVGSVVGRKRAEKKAKESERIAQDANIAMRTNYDNAVQTTDRMNDFTAMANFVGAYGGYKEGGVYDLDESEIKNLIDQGYEIKYL